MPPQGLSDARALARDRRLLDEAGVDGALAVAACEASADPHGALAALARLAAAARERHGRPPVVDSAALARVVPVLAGSHFLARELTARPRLLVQLRGTPWLDQHKPEELLHAQLQARLRRLEPGDEPGLLRALRRFKQRELLRIAARDLGGHATLPDVAAELSALASSCVDGALLFVAEEAVRAHGLPAGGEGRAAAGLCVLGMGKLGAGELNFSSDIDLVLVYGQDGETAGGTAGRLSNRELYSRIAERLTRALAAQTEDGFGFRVDLNLRPLGRSGAIAQSAEATLRYYEAHGRTWERAALLKARPVAGDRALGTELLAALEPFIYRRSLDLQAVEEIRAMKAQIDRESSGGEPDLKLGPGGIREVEFFVAALQLLQAGRDRRLRERGTPAALDKLLFAGVITGRDHDALLGAWLLLRRAEHRLQMLDERQTHTLPADPGERALLARRLGYAGSPADALAAFESELARRRGEVARIFGDLLGAAGAAPRPADPALLTALDPAAPEDARVAALAERGFHDPEHALAQLARLARRPGTPFAPDPPLALLGEAERLLAEVARTPDPDQALDHLAAFASATRSPAQYFGLLAEHPPVARLFLQLFGTSDFLSKYFLRHPELVDQLVRAVRPRKGAEALRAEAHERLAALPADEPERLLAALRRFKNEEVLRIGLADVSGALDLHGVQEELTSLADACLAECLALATAELTERYGPPGGGAVLSIAGLGKLGGRELGYHSDLDLVFVYSSPEGESGGGSRGRVGNPEWFARVAQRLVSFLQLPLREGILYKIDTRLRPSGSQGTLVVSLAALAAYHRDGSALWERQALLRARHVAGDAALFARARQEVLVPALFRPGSDARVLAQAIAAMRARMEAELSGEQAGARNPKTGYGGLVDVEFAVQYLQLLHGAAQPEVRTPATPEAIDRLAAAGILQPPDAALLREAYRFLRRLELRLRIVHDHGIGKLPDGGFALVTLARRLGYAGDRAGEELLADYGRITRGVRAAFRRLLSVP